MSRAAWLAVAVALCGCAPSTAEVRRARSTAYAAPFAVVWNTVTEEVERKFPRTMVEDAVKGYLETDWHLIEHESTDQAAVETNTLPTGIFLRLKVQVRNGPPWQVTIIPEAAEYRVGMAKLSPIAEGAGDEPPWMKGRVDTIYVAIYRRLKGHGVAIVAAPPRPASAPSVDLTPWPNLDAPAARMVAQVHAAAAHRDTAALRPLMDPDFTWSLGAAPSADAAVAMWGADPTLLRALAATLEAGCGAGDERAAVTCPAGARADGGSGARAGFRRIDGTWKLAFFLAGQ